jgi:hypothetical protein
MLRLLSLKTIETSETCNKPGNKDDSASIHTRIPVDLYPVLTEIRCEQSDHSLT